MTKILLIEDDAPLSRMYRTAFLKAGFDILHAGDGVEGLRVARDERPDLILLDIVLPKKNGYEVLKELRASNHFGNTLIYCLSVLHQEEDIQKSINFGADDFFVKTDIAPDKLVMKVIRKIERAKLANI